jgi:hypothetical protein
LIRSYAKGVSDDDAFTTAFGVDTAAFEAAWLKDIGAKPPVRQGPAAAPIGPLPSGWAGPLVIPSVVPAGSAGNAPGPTGQGGSAGDGSTIAIVIVVLVLLAVLGAAAIVMRRRRAASRRGPW